MGNFWSLVTIIGPILFVVVVVWAIIKNKQTSARVDAEAERGARQVREDIRNSDVEQ